MALLCISHVPPIVLREDALGPRFDALDRWLVGHRALWRPRPFSQLPVPWATEHPELSAWLSGLDDEHIDAIDAGAQGLQAPEMLPPVMAAWLREAAALTVIGRWPGGDDPLGLEHRSRLGRGIRGRKWDQVQHFAAAVMPPSPSATHLLDWCGGTGHLGRTLGVLAARPVTVLELDGRMEERALFLARRDRADLSFAQGDALDPAARDRLGGGAMVVALHACGGLTNALIEGVNPPGVPDVAVAPCCFHLLHAGHEGWRPLSSQGRAAGLDLDHATLRLATAEEVHAAPPLRRRRRRESAWRLGLDLLLREATGEDLYTPLGTLDAATLALPFEAFCREVAAAQRLALPARWNADSAQDAGTIRARTARALGLVRALFRRPLELWLVLDRALALRDRGYEVGVGAFCERSITPRNLLIRGRRGAE